MAEQRTSFDNHQSKSINKQVAVFFPADKLGHSAVALEIPPSNQQIERVKENYGQPDELLQKFIRFVKFHAIEPFDIWEDSKAMSADDFTYRVESKLGYRFSQLERFCLLEMTKESLLKQESFISTGLWNKKNKINLMTSISQKSILEIQKRRIITAKPQNASIPNTNDNFRMSKTPQIKQQMFIKTSRESLTKTFLRTALGCSQSQDLKLEALRADLEMNALQKKWEFVVMAGEMNKWIEQSRSEEQRKDGFMPPKFKVINRLQNFVLLRVEGENEEVIPEVVFLKKYNALKKKHPSGQSQCKPVKKVGKNPQQTCVKAPVSRLNSRDQELNESLLQIMRVKNILQFQYRILTETAINT